MNDDNKGNDMVERMSAAKKAAADAAVPITTDQSLAATARPGSTDRRRRRWFRAVLVISFLLIFIFNYLTPMMSDDYSYGALARGAGSLWGLVEQERLQYLTWTGRSVVHLLLRISLVLPSLLFKLCNSLVFLLLAWLIYLNIDHHTKYDVVMLLFIFVGLWFFTVDFEQTILWQTGAVNYLWGTTIVLLFMTVCRRYAASITVDRRGKTDGKAAREGVSASASATETPPLKSPSTKSPQTVAELVIQCLGFALLGIPAGWCNENTSGGCLLYVCGLLIYAGIRNHRLSWPLLSAAIGNAAGLAFMVLAPGNAIRSQFQTEQHTGLYAIFSRFQKVTLHVSRYFFWLLAAFLVLVIVAFLQRRHEGRRVVFHELRSAFCFLILFIVTSYALILTPETQARAFFGAGIFLLIAVLILIRKVLDWEITWDDQARHAPMMRPYAGTGFAVRGLLYSLLSVFLLYFIFVYFDSGANLARIYRDCRERDAYVQEQKAQGKDDITVAQVHPAFYNDYSAIEVMELQEDPDYWTNGAYETYMGVSRIRAIPYDDWAVMTGREDVDQAGMDSQEDNTQSARSDTSEEMQEPLIRKLPGLH